MLSIIFLLGLFGVSTIVSAGADTLAAPIIKRSEYEVSTRNHRRHHAKGLKRRQCKSSSSSHTANAASVSQATEATITSDSVNVTISSSGSGSGSGFGRALAWAMNDQLAPLFVNSKIQTYYHWENPIVAGLTNQQYIPQLWGTSKLSLFQSVMSKYSDNNLPEWIMGFNEPDLPMQSNMSPGEAAAAWTQYIQPYAAKGVKLAAPQLSWNHDWYRSFFAACDGCTFDAIGMHWYGAVSDLAGFKNAVTSFWTEFNSHAKEMWITEYSVTASSGGSEAEVFQFAKDSTAFIEDLDYVTLKAFFGAWSQNPDGYASSNGRFIDGSNQLTEIGKWWIS